MARPIKTKIDYFPIDCCDDSRMKLVELKHGLVAYAVYVKLLQKIYGNKGYYMNWDEDILLLFSGEYNLSVEKVDSIVTDMLGRGIFNKELFEKYGILTSCEIQEQYLFVIAKRKNKELDERFCLINSEKTVVDCVDNTHSIVEDSIVKDSISEERIGDKKEKEKAAPSTTPTPRGRMENVILTAQEYDRLKAAYPNVDRHIDDLSLYMASVGKDYPSHYATLIRWAEEDKAKQPPQNTERNSSYDIDEFFEAALRRSQKLIAAGDLDD